MNKEKEKKEESKKLTLKMEGKEYEVEHKYCDIHKEELMTLTPVKKDK